MQQAHRREPPGIYLDLFRAQSASRAAPAAAPQQVGRTARRCRASGQQHLGHGPLLEVLPEAWLEAVSRSTQHPATCSHTPDRNRTGGSSAGPRVSGNRTAQRLLPGRGTGKQQAAPPVPAGPPRFPWLLTRPRCASLFSRPRSRSKRCFATDFLVGASPQLGGGGSSWGNCPHLSSESPRKRFNARKVRPLGTPRGCSRARTGSLPCWDHLWAELQG